MACERACPGRRGARQNVRMPAPRSRRPLAFWFLGLAALALLRLGAHGQRGTGPWQATDAAWALGATVLLALGLALLRERR